MGEFVARNMYSRFKYINKKINENCNILLVNAEEDVSSYWMTFRKREYVGNLRRKH